MRSSTSARMFTGIAAGVIAAAVVTLPAAASAARSVSAPAAVAAHAASLHFTTLTLENGWYSEQPAYGTGAPRVAKDASGIVYLAGSLATAGSDDTAFVLPSADRPSHVLYVPIYTFDGGTGGLSVLPSGKVDIYGGNATEYSSLAGVSFASAHATGVTFHTMPLENGWKSEQHAYRTGAPAAGKTSDGIVYLTGAMANGTAGAIAFTLPAGDRPSRVVNVPIYSDGGSTASAYILPSGSVEVYGSQATTFTSVAGLSFPAAGKTSLSFSSLALGHGWRFVKSYGTSRPQVARSSDGVVILRGSLASGTHDDAFVLPLGDRPAHALYLPMWTPGGEFGTIFIDPDGSASLYGGEATAQSSIDGVSFSTKS